MTSWIYIVRNVEHQELTMVTAFWSSPARPHGRRVQWALTTEPIRYQNLLQPHQTSVILDHAIPDSKVHGTNMGHTWVLSSPGGPHVGPMNLAIRDDKQRVLMHGHQGWNVRHGLCHIYMIYVYIWVVYSFCLFCCLFIFVTTQFVALYKPCKPKPKPSTYDPPPPGQPPPGRDPNSDT